MEITTLNAYIKLHRAQRLREAPRWKKYLMWYRAEYDSLEVDDSGQFIVDDDIGLGEDEARSTVANPQELRVAKNYTFVIVDTIATSVCPNSVIAEVTSYDEAKTPVAERYAHAIQDAFKRNNNIKRLKRQTRHTSLFGRGYRKTTWDTKKHRAVIRTIHPKFVWIDTQAEVWEDLRYLIHITVITEAEFAARKAKGFLSDGSALYTTAEAKKVEPDRYPSWVNIDDWKVDEKATSDDEKNRGKWMLVYEVYDFQEKKYYHAAHTKDSSSDAGKSPVTYLYESKLPYSSFENPFDTTVFNDGLEGLLGIPDPQLIERPQERLTEMDDMSLQFAHQNIPRLIINKTGLTNASDFIEQIEVGGTLYQALVVELAENPLHKTSLSDVLAFTPTASIGMEFHHQQARLESIIEFSVGLPGYIRGQGGTSDVATDLALIHEAAEDRRGERRAVLLECLDASAIKVILLTQELAPPDFRMKLRDRTGRNLIVGREELDLDAPGSKPKLDEEYDFTIIMKQKADVTKALLMQKLLPVIQLLMADPKYGPKIIPKILELIGMADLVPEDMPEDMSAAMAEATPPGGSMPSEGMSLPDPVSP